MPKIRTQEDIARRYLYAGKQAELIRKTGMATSTFYHKKEKPIERLSGHDLAALILAQNLDPEEINHVLRIFL